MGSRETANTEAGIPIADDVGGGTIAAFTPVKRVVTVFVCPSN